MYSISKKLRYLFGALFLVAWLVSAVQIGKQQWKPDRETDITRVEKAVSDKAKSTLNNTSLLLTAFVGVIHFINQK